MQVSGSTRLAGIIGWPVSHSLSPRLHNFWLERYGIDGIYVPLPVTPQNFATACKGLRASGFMGANVTLPHKQAAFALCDVLDQTAERAGAVNTLLFEEDCVGGFNTDGAGFVESLREADVDRRGAALVLGAGGAARGIAACLLECGMSVAISARDGQAARTLCESFPGLTRMEWPPWGRLGGLDILVNATAGGMSGKPALNADLSRASAGLAVADIVYTPVQTPLLADALHRGLRVVSGDGMLLHQAAIAFELWFGLRPAIDAELRAFLLE